MSETSTGLSENVASALTYVLGFLTGIIFLIVEKENSTVRFHAAQSIVVFGALFVLNVIFSYVLSIIASLLGLVGFVLWIYLIVMAFQGNDVKLPVISEYAEKLLQ
ncbi:hypothetical protein D5R95_07170 [Methanosalsum natronophilum]|uniref:DUF4870 domain-containing protein n=1 Tax=Methanosalsum natronophilum TaxID=768733 RepID=A0A424YU65_9EURY|nr:MAG: hypothetical protein D5R95_07170 [Methanosalsum natronophilum]